MLTDNAQLTAKQNLQRMISTKRVKQERALAINDFRTFKRVSESIDRLTKQLGVSL